MILWDDEPGLQQWGSEASPCQQRRGETGLWVSSEIPCHWGVGNRDGAKQGTQSRSVNEMEEQDHIKETRRREDGGALIGVSKKWRTLIMSKQEDWWWRPPRKQGGKQKTCSQCLCLSQTLSVESTQHSPV